MKTHEYYDASASPVCPSLNGSGVIGIMLGDQLHPPMIDDDAMWSNGKRWYTGALDCTLRLARMANISPGMKIADIG